MSGEKSCGKYPWRNFLTERPPESGICHKKSPTGSDFQRCPINYQWAW